MKAGVCRMRPADAQGTDHNQTVKKGRSIPVTNDTGEPDSATTAPHLWEVGHPYYCSEGNYFVPGTRWDEVHNEYDSWAEFIADWGDTDSDLNLVFRWDWSRDDGEYRDEGEDPEPDKLSVFWVLQRKAILRSTVCTVTEADEPAVRAWLTERAKTMTALWAPLSIAPQPDGQVAE